MEKVLEHMPLTEGEEVKAYLYGDSYNLDFSALARLIAFFTRIVSVILGVSKKKHVFVTNKRVITVDFQKVLWFINNGIDAHSHTPRSINQIGYTRRRSLLIFVTHYFSFNNTIIKAIGGKDTVYLIIDAANDLAEKVTSKKETASELFSNDSSADHEPNNQLIELTNSIRKEINLSTQHCTSLLEDIKTNTENKTNSGLDENQVNESLVNLKWQTHYLKILSEK